MTTIAILDVGAPPPSLAARFGDYPAMVRRLIGDGADYITVPVADGAEPGRMAAADAAIITGSPAGVGDRLPWIAPLIDWVRAVAGTMPLAGICFGHQLIAHALGGQVAKVARGWGVGLHRYALLPDGPIAGVGALAAIASHQDQVVAAPPSARVVGSSAFTPFALLDYPGQRTISMQCHPEFEPDFARALLAASRAPNLDPDRRAAGLASLDQPADAGRLAEWIRWTIGMASRSG